MTPESELRRQSQELLEIKSRAIYRLMHAFKELAAYIEDDEPTSVDHIPSLVSVLKFQLGQKGSDQAEPSIERRVIDALLHEYRDEYSKAACDNCADCVSLVMCNFHSILSVLSGGTRIHDADGHLLPSVVQAPPPVQPADVPPVRYVDLGWLGESGVRHVLTQSPNSAAAGARKEPSNENPRADVSQPLVVGRHRDSDPVPDQKTPTEGIAGGAGRPLEWLRAQQVNLRGILASGHRSYQINTLDEILRRELHGLEEVEATLTALRAARDEQAEMLAGVARVAEQHRAEIEQVRAALAQAQQEIERQKALVLSQTKLGTQFFDSYVVERRRAKEAEELLAQSLQDRSTVLAESGQHLTRAEQAEALLAQRPDCSELRKRWAGPLTVEARQGKYYGTCVLDASGNQVVKFWTASGEPSSREKAYFGAWAAAARADYCCDSHWECEADYQAALEFCRLVDTLPKGDV